MRAATEAKQWDVVGLVVEEMKARRPARAGKVVQMTRRREGGER